MKKFIAAIAIILMGTSAMAQYGGPHRGPRHGGYPGGSNEAASILSAYTGALFLTSASQCNSPYGCAYKEIIVDAKEDAATAIATDGEVVGSKLNRALELLRQMDPSTTSSDLKLAQDILEF